MIDALSRLVSARRAVAAAALLACTGAWAGVQVDVGIGRTMSGGGNPDDLHAPVFDFDLGYRTGNVAVQFVNISEWDIGRMMHWTPGDPNARYGFDSFFGGQVVGYLPLAPMFEAYGGLGAGGTRRTNGSVDASPRHQADGLLSAGLQFHPPGVFTLGVGVDYLTETHVSAASMRFQFGF